MTRETFDLQLSALNERLLALGTMVTRVQEQAIRALADRNTELANDLGNLLSRVMTNAQEKFFLPARADGQPRELRLQLNREPQRLKTAPEAPKTDEHGH